MNNIDTLRFNTKFDLKYMNEYYVLSGFNNPKNIYLTELKLMSFIEDNKLWKIDSNEWDNIIEENSYLHTFLTEDNLFEKKHKAFTLGYNIITSFSNSNGTYGKVLCKIEFLSDLNINNFIDNEWNNSAIFDTEKEAITEAYKFILDLESITDI